MVVEFKSNGQSLIKYYIAKPRISGWENCRSSSIKRQTNRCNAHVHYHNFPINFKLISPNNTSGISERPIKTTRTEGALISIARYRGGARQIEVRIHSRTIVPGISHLGTHRAGESTFAGYYVSLASQPSYHFLTVVTSRSSLGRCRRLPLSMRLRQAGTFRALPVADVCRVSSIWISRITYITNLYTSFETDGSFTRIIFTKQFSA